MAAAGPGGGGVRPRLQPEGGRPGRSAVVVGEGLEPPSLLRDGTQLRSGLAHAGMTMEFSEDYPSKPPKCHFKLIDGKPLFHPNVYPSGAAAGSETRPHTVHALPTAAVHSSH